jgi:hypothetical protein
VTLSGQQAVSEVHQRIHLDPEGLLDAERHFPGATGLAIEQTGQRRPRDAQGCETIVVFIPAREPDYAATTTVPLARLTQGSTYPAFFCSAVSPASTSI